MKNKNKILKKRITQTVSLNQAVENIFDAEMNGRTYVLENEAIGGIVAREYNILGKTSRNDTYRKICEDFKNSAECYAKNHLNMDCGTIVDIGCGSGLLSLPLSEKTNGYILGIDSSTEMIDLAYKNLKEYSQKKLNGAEIFQKRIHNNAKRKGNLAEFVKPAVEFRKGSVYYLPELVSDKKNINYILCRNALHRFRNPKEAIQKMYSVLSSGGKIYIRDIRRDANWETVISRIGKQRWTTPCLVEDYIGAMASMLNTGELEKILKEIGIKNYKIRDGCYNTSENSIDNSNLKEYESEVEYVCVIKKVLSEG
ncbi:class I SAM-dependent methyltransferase [Candidatus Pacearchaeota archaeon]|nr:class I SAM-dependent methyltransferase [Candidatus Pacearchaeota archaeon]